MPDDKQLEPNEDTEQAIKELESGNGQSFSSLDEMLKALESKPPED